MARSFLKLHCFTIPHALYYAVILLTLAPSLNAGNLSATISLTSDYVFRGVSNTDAPALQGSVDYAYENGVYIGMWASNYDFGSAANAELDYYIGYDQSLNEDINLSVSASHYTFNGEHTANYNEFQIGLSRGPVDFKVWYATDYFGTSGDAQYYEAGFTTKLPKQSSLEIRAGRSLFDTQVGSRDYTDYSIAISRSFARLDTKIQLTDTNENQFGNRENLNLVITVSTTFQ